MEKSVLAMLKKSTISDHNKYMTRMLLPVMSAKNVTNTYNALRTEADKMGKFEQKEKRVTLKYKVMVDSLASKKARK